MSLITKFITRFSSYLLKHKEKKHFTTPIKHTLTISDYLFESKASEIAIAFSEACHQNNFNTFSKYIAENIVFVINNKETIHGKENFINFWITRNHKIEEENISIHTEIKHCILYNRPYIINEPKRRYKKKNCILFRINEDKITHAVYIFDPFSESIGVHYFDITRPPFAFDRFYDQIKKDTIPANKNRVPCLWCGTLSENLKWYNIDFIKDSYNYKGWISFCPKCKKVIEQNIEIIGLRKKQSIEITKVTLGLDKDIVYTQYQNSLDEEMKYTYQLSNKGVEFHRILKILKVDRNIEPCIIYKYLDLIKPLKPFQLGLKFAENKGFENESRFYVYDNCLEKWDYFNYLNVEENEMGAWQAYLLYTAKTKLPTWWHGGYIHRDFIFYPSDLDKFIELEGIDLTHFGPNGYLFPSVEMKGKTAYVNCCYWNYWKGLVRETVQIDFENNKVARIETIKTETLMEYHCGIWY